MKPRIILPLGLLLVSILTGSAAVPDSTTGNFPNLIVRTNAAIKNLTLGGQTNIVSDSGSAPTFNGNPIAVIVDGVLSVTTLNVDQLNLANSWTTGNGSPEGVVTANPGAGYGDNLTGYMYTKWSGTGNTGWRAGGGSGGGAGTWSTGSGSPEGVITAGPGATYGDVVTGFHYIKWSGTGNTGWQVGG